MPIGDGDVAEGKLYAHESLHGVKTRLQWCFSRWKVPTLLGAWSSGRNRMVDRGEGHPYTRSRLRSVPCLGAVNLIGGIPAYNPLVEEVT